MALPANIVTKFRRIVRYDVAKYLNDYVDFIDNHRSNVFEYYSGDSRLPNTQSFEFLFKLLKESDVIDSLIEQSKHRLNTPEYWELIDSLSQIKESLKTTENSSKWMRSIITKNNFSPEIEIESVLKQSQTIEQLSSSLGSNSSDNDWVQMALRNDLREEDYSTEGGTLILSSYRNKMRINVQSVVDNINGEKIYGADFDRKITFTNDDINVLSYKNTIKQTVEVLASLRSGQTPEFPLDGIQANLLVGSNRASVPYPVLFRQFYATFKRDDTLKSLRVKQIEIQKDSLNLSFEVETMMGEFIHTETAI